jgi:hypothetical protein
MDQAKLTSLRLQDRAELETLLTALNGAKNAIQRDQCGDWTIKGSRGTIRACDGKFYVYIPSGSPQAWTWAKKLLTTFTIPSQDGDDEGILTLDHMPTETEAETLRDYIGLRQTRDIPADRIQKALDARQIGSVGRQIA